MAEKEIRTAADAHAQCEQILRSDFHKAEPSWVAEATFGLLVIQLKDVLQTLAKEADRIAFDNDMPEGWDVTKLVTEIRNAFCHIGSPLRHIGTDGKLSFARIHGQAIGIRIDGFVHENPYPDDVAFIYGRHLILLRRHIWRATQEAGRQLDELMKQIRKAEFEQRFGSAKSQN